MGRYLENKIYILELFLTIISRLSKSYNRSAPNIDSLVSYFANKLSLSPDFYPSLSTVPPESDVTYKKPGE